MLQKGFFLTESHNPNLPAEEWTLVFEKTTQGAFSQNFGWGKYKVEMSGGGGSGATRMTNSSNMEFVYCQKGFSGELQTTIVPVYSGTNQTFSGTVGGGGKGSSVNIRQENNDFYTTTTYGAVGQGYENGLTPNTKYEYSATSPFESNTAGGWVGGSGGGSTGLLIDGILKAVAKGGNGGGVRINYYGYKTSDGGAGGSGGTTAGTGVSGGNAASDGGTGTRTSGNGSDGYIRIYKSNLKPEPV